MKNTIKKITPNSLLSAYHFLLSFLGAVFYGFPSRKLKIIGVTGTNGKSTTVFLINQILEKAGYKTASSSSIYFTTNGDIELNNLKMTMPGRFKIHKFLRRAVEAGCQYAVLEITSEGIKQHRHRFIGFDTAVFTNLTPEHIESHGGFENYKKAKGKLFQSLKPNGKSIVNLDDPNSHYFLRFAAKEKWGYTLQQGAAPVAGAAPVVKGEKIEIKKSYSSFFINNSLFIIHLLGKFNISNALAAIAVGTAEGISLEKMKLALGEIKGIPGRLEIVTKELFTVIVDYAHTPDALEKVYQTARKMSDGKLIGVLGSAGGGRDKWKRPEMGKIAEKYLDMIIITNEDPYDEDPSQIISEIVEGIKNKEVKKIIDRREAIRYALKIAEKDDVVIITGKGCELWMCVEGNKKIPWDDRKVVKEEI
ncbi:UDP-N-acetylmuramoyl-L-alanyl-D-glutamate--2,6-diaminopimelate ligase [Patescibacteria group bacterium]|nr:UDP-N-acetylmuramoyl-L-alanyl-D-glutamate--2,6-diaminopimelate ligase [Patescibacteria group bacterium]MCG2808803.1 UDP-N-acetylmuramoyl-L-alanyl-D-glutamate--2,6-diaminopimelate ligase [Candidatus Portnoybacteria bacterium]